ncbi:MAG: DUF2867 domain-containing protein [Deltaproteobacteria bacterium]|nr:DUF2867 domain-containing protein [Deltaproteobacteria bacterium]MBW1849440.1 DUF2867 domain-containing protein [Deltaproteobacteria bacterium]MBW2180547.1 DUF2867 domain-containing protein [Deltaproteobacteria bacterium]
MLKKKLSSLPYLIEIQPFLKGSNHVDVKTIDGNVSLREFIASMMSYAPWWLVLLYRIRTIVARVLGLEKQIELEGPFQISPEDISFTPGGNAHFFIVRKAKEDQYLISETPEDKHLSAYLAISVENLDGNLNRFHVTTIVFYKHWTGPVYFNLIRPFHHLVVRQMMRAGISQRK